MNRRVRAPGWSMLSAFLLVAASLAGDQGLNLDGYTPAYGWTKTADLDLGGESVTEWQPRYEETVLRVVRTTGDEAFDLQTYTTDLAQELKRERKRFKLEREGTDRIHDLTTHELICTFKSDALRKIVKHHVVVFMSGGQVYRVELTAPKDRYDAHHSVLLNTALEIGKRLAASTPVSVEPRPIGEDS